MYVNKFSASYVSKVLDERPVDEHEADTMSILFFIQHLPCHCSLIGNWPPHARQANSTLKTHKTLLPCTKEKEEREINLLFTNKIKEFTFSFLEF